MREGERERERERQRETEREIEREREGERGREKERDREIYQLILRATDVRSDLHSSSLFFPFLFSPLLFFS